MVKQDLYEVLGVDKSADKPVIKSAFRRAAKKSHPDKGGNTEKFALIKHAHDILMDDDRRKKYDATGDDSEKSPDNAFSTEVNIIAMAFGLVLQDCQQNGQSPLEIDMIVLVERKLKSIIAEFEKQTRIMKFVIETDRKMAGRFKRKKKTERNIFDDIVAHRLTALEMNLRATEENIKNHKAALQTMSEFSYRKDAGSESITHPSGITYFTFPS